MNQLAFNQYKKTMESYGYMVITFTNMKVKSVRFVHDTMQEQVWSLSEGTWIRMK